MKKLLALLLCFAMLLSLLAACSKEKEDTIVGTWIGEVDTYDHLRSNSIDDGDEERFEELVKIFGVSGMTMKFTLALDEDGTYIQTIDEDFWEDFKEVAAEGLTKYFEAQLIGTGYTVDDLLASKGYSSMEEVLEELAPDAKEAKGTWELKDRKLILTPDDEEKNVKEYSCELDGDKMILEKHDAKYTFERD